MVTCNTKDANSIDFLCDLGIIVMEQKYLEGGIKMAVSSIRLDDELEKPYLDMSPREMELDMQRAVHNRSVEDQDAFVTLFDDTGRMYRRYDDGRVEYVLL